MVLLAVCLSEYRLRASSFCAPKPEPEPTQGPSPTGMPPSGSIDLSGNVGNSMGSCGDPIVPETVASHSEACGKSGLTLLKRDEAKSKLAQQHSRQQCNYVPFSSPLYSCMEAVRVATGK